MHELGHTVCQWDRGLHDLITFVGTVAEAVGGAIKDTRT
jgi:hypothetical protein